jgi:hypothetical protein
MPPLHHPNPLRLSMPDEQIDKPKSAHELRMHRTVALCLAINTAVSLCYAGFRMKRATPGGQKPLQGPLDSNGALLGRFDALLG